MAPPLRLVPPVIGDVDDPDDGTLGGLFAAFGKEIHRILDEGRGVATEGSLGGVLMHLADLAHDYDGVPMPDPDDRT